MEEPAEIGAWSAAPELGIGRRSFLRLALWLTGGTVLLAPSPAWGFLFPSSRAPGSGTRSAPGGRIAVPDEWVSVLGRDVVAYVDYLSRLRLRRIKVGQIIEPHLRKRGNVQNRIPPRAMWRNIRDSLRAADRIGDRLGEPVREIVSAYRSPQYNARCPGARSNSFHVRNMALDLRFRSSPRQVAMVARELRNRGMFTGGVGRYSTFTHIDTRGRKADW